MNQTFRENFRSYFANSFCEISHFFAKINEAKNERTMQNFAKKIVAKNISSKILHFANIFSRKPKDLKLYLVFFDGISCIFFKFQFFCEIFAFSLKISYFALLVTRLQV